MKSFSITLQYELDAAEDTFTQLRLLKGKSKVPADVLSILNETLFAVLVEPPIELDDEPASRAPVQSMTPITTPPETPPVTPVAMATQPPATIQLVPPQPIIGSNSLTAVSNQFMQEQFQQFLQQRLACVPSRSSVEIGRTGESAIMDCLLKISSVNQDFEVDDTSSMKGHGDIAVRYQGKRICVEVKNYKTRVPAKEIIKYRKSLALAEYDAGIMIQITNHGFAQQENIRSPIDLKFENCKPSAYLTAVDPEMIYPVINMLIVSIQAAVDESVFERKCKALTEIHDKVLKMRKAIDTQKKAVISMESAVEAIVKLSVE